MKRARFAAPAGLILLALTGIPVGLHAAEIISNGNFGTIVYKGRGTPAVITPSSDYWNTDAPFTSKAAVLSYCTEQSGCPGILPSIAGCFSTSANRVSQVTQFVPTNKADVLKPNTRYYLSFTAFRDTTGIDTSTAAGKSWATENMFLSLDLITTQKGVQTGSLKVLDPAFNA